MKKIISIFIAMTFVLSVLTVSAAAIDDETVLVSNNINCTIIIPENANEQEKYAADTMQKYIYQITGIKLQIRDDSSEKYRREIVIGDTSRKSIDISALSDGGYCIEYDNYALYIAGSGKRGNIYGVYAFLEKYCGFRMYTSTLKEIPKSDKITLPDTINYTYQPYFEYTETDWKSPCNAEYSIANGLNGGTYRTLSSEQGGTVNYISNYGHTLTTQFCAATTYFDTHPEYFALHNGKRTQDQLCLTNPDVLQIVTDEVLELIRRRHDSSQALQIVSLTQNDNLNYCTCDKCNKLDSENDSHSGTMISFANSVARAVKQAGYDNIAIDTFAYQYTRKAPTSVVPDSNVIVRLCSIECCFGHALNSPDCKENVDFMSDLSAWGKICNRVYIWDYTTNYLETLNIFPDFGVLQQNMQTFFENGVKGIYEEGNYYIADCDGEFGELRAYLLSKLMQNPYIDYYAAMNDFLKAYYGNGWEYIREFIDITTEKGVTAKKHLSIYQDSNKSLPDMKSKDISHGNELWDKALNAAQTDEIYWNVFRSQICWRYWKCNNYKSEFSFLRPLYRQMQEREKLYNDFLLLGIKRTGERVTRPLSDCPTLYLMRRAEKWSELYDEPIWDFIAPAVVYIYNILKAVHGDVN